MEIPTIVIPPVKTIDTISIPLPTADVPSYIPLVVPPSDLREPEGTKPATTEKTEQPPNNHGQTIPKGALAGIQFQGRGGPNLCDVQF